MSAPQIEVQLIACVVAVACALPGVFLVLRRMALMSDAISHAILPGIVIAFFLTEDLASPILILAAAATGVITVLLVELVNRTGLVHEDAAIGLVFPLLFSIGVILISRYAGDVHLDTDAVLLGELAFAHLDRLAIGGHDLGPKSLWVMGVIFLLNTAFILIFFKELKVATFDPGLAAAIGLSPALVHYGLMVLVSITAVGAFDAVGSILVVALMIAPPSTAYLLTERLSRMILLSAVVGVLSAVGGYWVAHLRDVSIAGSMATVAGILFALTYTVAPDCGLVALALRRRRQKWEFHQRMLVIHLRTHEGLPEAAQECRVAHLHEHLRWNPAFAAQVVGRAERQELVVRADGLLELTDRGRKLARESVVG